VAGAAVTVKNASGSTLAGPVSTGSGGTFSINVPTSDLSADLRFEATGGSYIDEATGATTTSGTLSAYISAGTLSTTSVNLDPGSTIVDTLMNTYGMSATSAASAFSTAFGYTPDPSTAPKNDSTSDVSQRLAALRCGAFSQLTQNLGLAASNQSVLLSAIAQDLSDGTLNGRAGSSLISIGTGTSLPEDIGNRFENAFMTYFANTTTNMTGLTASDIGSLPFSKVALTESYRIEYQSSMSPSQGKSTFTLSITSRMTGSAVPGLSLTLMPMMHMASHDHTTPVDPVVDNGNGTYTCTVYYLMSSSMSGMSMGYWELEVSIGGMMGGESATFYPSVGMAMGSDTVLSKLRGQSGDIVTGMSGTEKRTYYIFNDGLASSMSGYTFSLFIAPGDYASMSSMISFPALASGATTTLHDENYTAWIADPVVVEASLDASTWTTATNSSTGHWNATFATGIMSGQTNTIYVRLSVGKDGGTTEQKTTDGNAPSGSNAYQTITATPGSMM
jgi:hypothetical protein